MSLGLSVVSPGVWSVASKPSRVRTRNWQEYEAWLKTLSLAPFLLCREAGKVMMKQNWGRIINVASVGGLVALPRQIAYCTTKAALIQLTKVLAVEWAGYGIRVNSLSPGPVTTPLQQSIYATPELLAARNRGIPMSRHGRPEEIGSAAVFLASDDASYVTGENLSVDGGSLASMYHLIHQLSGQQ